MLIMSPQNEATSPIYTWLLSILGSNKPKVPCPIPHLTPCKQYKVHPGFFVQVVDVSMEEHLGIVPGETYGAEHLPGAISGLRVEGEMGP